MIVLESLQMAQMVADLSELEAAVSHPIRHLHFRRMLTDQRNERARALLQANKEKEKEKEAEAAAAAAAAAASAPATPADDPSRPSMHHRGASATSIFSSVSASANGTASPFDSYLGRFLAPALTRANSSHGTGLNTPQSQSQNHNGTHSADVDRASSMVALHELRAKLKQYNDSASLRQARDKVAALSAQRQAGEHAASTSGPAHRNAHFTFPRD